MWNQDSAGIEGAAEAGDFFGSALAVGDFNKDGFADLAIGVPYEDVGKAINAGAVNVIYGSKNGLTKTGDHIWHQNSSGIPGAAQVDDYFGSDLGASDFDGDGYSDLAISVPGDDAYALVDVADCDAGHLEVEGFKLWDSALIDVARAAAGVAPNHSWISDQFFYDEEGYMYIYSSVTGRFEKTRDRWQPIDRAPVLDLPTATCDPDDVLVGSLLIGP